MMASEEDHAVYNEEDLDDDDDDDVDVDDDDVDDSTSSSNLATAEPILQQPPLPPLPPSSTVAATAAPDEVTIAVIGLGANTSTSSVPDPKRERVDDVVVASRSITASAVVEEKKPSAAFDESRKLFQRLWTDEDEIELLQGFLDYTAQRAPNNSSHHHDTTAFYDQIKSKLQLDFNKNQLVEKLRRLKKKYRNVMNKIGSGKEYVFKSAHDQATFEISRKIWSGSGGSAVHGGVIGSSAVEDGGFDDDDPNSSNPNFIDHSPNLNPNPNGMDIRTPRSRKRSRVVVKLEDKQGSNHHYNPQPPGLNMATPVPAATAAASATAPATTSPVLNLIEETVKSCLSPILKELLQNAVNLNNSRGFGLGIAVSPTPLGVGFGIGGSLLSGELAADEKWRKQQILELEVYSKRLELVQDQIKAKLEELRSLGT